MTKIIKIELTSCKGCPYLSFYENTGSGNYSGWSVCEKEKLFIEKNVEFPVFPDWCPLENK